MTGGCSPFGLWPGVDVRWTRSLCLFEAAGYQHRDMTLVLSCPSTHRAPPPEGIELRRVLDDADADAALAWCAGIMIVSVALCAILFRRRTAA